MDGEAASIACRDIVCGHFSTIIADSLLRLPDISEITPFQVLIHETVHDEVIRIVFERDDLTVDRTYGEANVFRSIGRTSDRDIESISVRGQLSSVKLVQLILILGLQRGHEQNLSIFHRRHEIAAVHILLSFGLEIVNRRLDIVFVTCQHPGVAQQCCCITAARINLHAFIIFAGILLLGCISFECGLDGIRTVDNGAAMTFVVECNGDHIDVFLVVNARSLEFVDGADGIRIVLDGAVYHLVGCNLFDVDRTDAHKVAGQNIDCVEIFGHCLCRKTE